MNITERLIAEKMELVRLIFNNNKTVEAIIHSVDTANNVVTYIKSKPDKEDDIHTKCNISEIKDVVNIRREIYGSL